MTWVGVISPGLVGGRWSTVTAPLSIVVRPILRDFATLRSDTSPLTFDEMAASHCFAPGDWPESFAICDSSSARIAIQRSALIKTSHFGRRYGGNRAMARPAVDMLALHLESAFRA
jgi:hypothetical protein